MENGGNRSCRLKENRRKVRSLMLSFTGGWLRGTFEAKLAEATV